MVREMLLCTLRSTWSPWDDCDEKGEKTTRIVTKEGAEGPGLRASCRENRLGPVLWAPALPVPSRPFPSLREGVWATPVAPRVSAPSPGPLLAPFQSLSNTEDGASKTTNVTRAARPSTASDLSGQVASGRRASFSIRPREETRPVFEALPLLRDPDLNSPAAALHPASVPSSRMQNFTRTPRERAHTHTHVHTHSERVPLPPEGRSRARGGRRGPWGAGQRFAHSVPTVPGFRLETRSGVGFPPV